MTSSTNNHSRRYFLTRLVKAGLLTAVAGYTGLRLYDDKGPSLIPSKQPAAGIPSYVIDGMKPQVAIVHDRDRAKSVTLGLKTLGGIEAFVKKGERVLLKVNAAFASPPVLSATTHPELVTALTRLCLKAGAAEVRVADNPINDPATCFELSGIGPAARAAGARVVLPRQSLFQPVSVDQGRLLQNWPVFTGALADIDKVIGVAPVKDHHRSGASMTIKNWYGLLGGRRNIFHQEIHDIIYELALMVRPSLVILDGTMTMLKNGPTGGALDDLKKTETMIVGTDPVAVDTAGALLLEKSIDTLPHLAKAEAAGLGTTDLNALRPVVVNQG